MIDRDSAPLVLVLPGWYPSLLEPNNGDFIRTQVDILRRGGVSMDLLFCDLNVRYLKYCQITPVESLHIDPLGNKTWIYSAPFVPKNSSWGLKKWLTMYAYKVDHYIQQYGFPDLIHAHTYLGAMVAKVVQQSYEIPYIVTEHYTGWMDDSMRSKHQSMGIEALNHAHEVYAVSPALAQCLGKALKKMPDLLPNFVDQEIFFPSSQSRREGVFHLLGVGDLIHRKQWDHLIRAFKKIYAQLPDAHLTIIGEGPCRGALETLVRDHGLYHCISLVGQCTPIEVAEAMRCASVLVHTSRLETFGLVYLEALLCNLPVVSYDNGGVRLFEQMEGITIVALNDTIQLTHKVLALASGRQTEVHTRASSFMYNAIERQHSIYGRYAGRRFMH